jgi:transposase
MHVLSDANRLPLRVGLSAANTRDSQALKPMLSHFHMGHEVHAAESKPQRLPADMAYDVLHPRRWLWGKHIGVRIARKGIDSGERLGGRGWVIERAMSWSPAIADSTTATNATPATTRPSFHGLAACLCGFNVSATSPHRTQSKKLLTR